MYHADAVRSAPDVLVYGPIPIALHYLLAEE